MSNDNTLDDLILTDPEPEKAKSKGLLALLALVILLIIVGAILAKMIFSDPAEPTKKKDEQKVEVASDINANLDNVTATNENDNNSDLAPISADPDLAPISDNSNDMPANIDTVNVDEAKNSNTNTKSDNKENKAELKGDSTKVAASDDDLGVAPVGAKVSSQKEFDTPKKVVVQENQQPRHTKQRDRARKHLIGGRGNVYIQVGSFTKGPESSFIRKIRRAGFKYRIRTQNGHRRVFVGPFESRKEASKYLGRVRSEINPQAFIK